MLCVTPDLRTLFGFTGITEVGIIAAGGTRKWMTGEVDAQTFLAPALEKVHAQASL
jgi:FMN-dependent NADH-azoreductase